MIDELTTRRPPPRKPSRGGRVPLLGLALFAVSGLALSCATTIEDERGTEDEPGEEAPGSGDISESGDVDEAVPANREGAGPALTAGDLNLGNNWELAPHPVTLATPKDAARESELSDEELKELAEQDPAWRAADGTRYEALLVIEGGTSYGRRGPAPEAETPGPENRYGEQNPTGIPAPPDAPLPDVDPEGILLHGALGDRRTKVSSVTTLTGFPEKTIGAMNQVTAAGQSTCTATKIGPRAALTASHCVFSQIGTVTPSGWFHPGQTTVSHPNTAGAVSFSGVAFRDYRATSGDTPSHREFDYAVIWLDDRSDSYGLGWLGVEYYNSSSPYTGKVARLLGYPKESGFCLDSNNGLCNGWMYRDSSTLGSGAYVTSGFGGQLAYDIDAEQGQSGSSVFTSTNGMWTVLGVHWGCDASVDLTRNRAARFRSSMWNDVCDWIAAVSSQHGQHPLCN